MLLAALLGGRAEAARIQALGCMLEPSKQVEVSSPVPGVLDDVLVRRGDPVFAGRILFTLKAGVESAAVELARARAEFAVAWHLHQQGRPGAAERHFERAGELAPDDWTIRRGSLPIRGKSPFFGLDFLRLFLSRLRAGAPEYHPRKDPRGGL